jgi:hypothetical protein
MALCTGESINTETMQLLTRLTKPGFPVGYARIESWHINPGDPSFVAMLALYANAQARDEDIANCAHYQIGCTLTQEQLAAITAADDRAVFYKAVEYIVHFQMYEQQLQHLSDPDEIEAFIAEKNALLAELDDGLGQDLSTIFILRKAV